MGCLRERALERRDPGLLSRFVYGYSGLVFIVAQQADRRRGALDLNEATHADIKLDLAQPARAEAADRAFSTLPGFQQQQDHAKLPVLGVLQRQPEGELRTGRRDLV